MELVRFGLLFLLITAAAAIRPPRQGLSYDIDLTYEIDFGTDDEGGCKSHRSQVETAYGDLLNFLQASIDAINDLRSSIPPNDHSTAANEWLRKADGVFALFGARVPSSGRQGSTDAGTANRIVSEVSLNLGRILNRHHQVVSAPPRPEFGLKCTDNWLKYLGPNDVDPTDPENKRMIKDNPEATQRSGGNPKNGIYFAKSAPAANVWFWPPGSKPNMKSPICESGRHSAWAESILPRSGDDPDHPLKLLTFCHSQFAEENWSAAESTTKIQSGDSFEKYYGAMAITWLHELGDDENAVNSKGHHFIESGSSGKAKVYGWKNSVWLAQKQPGIALKSPENYAIFAGTMFWSDWWWITGMAQKSAEVGERVGRTARP